MRKKSGLKETSRKERLALKAHIWFKPRDRTIYLKVGDGTLAISLVMTTIKDISRETVGMPRA